MSAAPKTIIIEIANHRVRINLPERQDETWLENHWREYLANCPTSLKGVHTTEQDKTDQAYYNALAKNLTGQADPNRPIGKQVI